MGFSCTSRSAPDIFFKLPGARRCCMRCCVRSARFPDAARSAQFHSMPTPAEERSPYRAKHVVTVTRGDTRRESAIFRLASITRLCPGPLRPTLAARAAELHRLLPNRKLILGVDRLDYTKGIPHRLQAVSKCLDSLYGARERSPSSRSSCRAGWIFPSITSSSPDRTARRRNQRSLDASRGLVSGVVRLQQSQPQRSARLLPGSSYRARDAAQGWHEPRRERILRVQHRRRMRARLSELPARVAASAWSASRQSVRYEGVADAIHRAYKMTTDERRNRMRRLRRGIREGASSGGWIPICRRRSSATSPTIRSRRRTMC